MKSASAVVELVGGFLLLLAEAVEGRERAAARGVGVDLDAVTDGVGGPEGEDGFGGVTFFGASSTWTTGWRVVRARS
jgi:hypothetical protein